MYYCDPPGTYQIENIVNHGTKDFELNYIFFHDQEPIHLDIHVDLFTEIVQRNLDLCDNSEALWSGFVTSEYQSEMVHKVCSIFDWEPYYYFFHGWAALDWYRGYNNTWLMPDPHERTMQKSFISANRIVAGHRQHRIKLMHQLLKHNVSNAHISFPLVCPAEQIAVRDVAQNLAYGEYHDIVNQFDQANFPWNFPEESGHPMHSCWLSLFDVHAESAVYVITETVYYGQRKHLTEKTFKPICMQMPFVMVSSAGSLEYLRSYGFRTFGDIWDESYDQEADDHVRLQKIGYLLKQIDNMTTAELQSLYESTIPVIKHNYDHFYNGGFERILTQELTGMLNTMQRNFNYVDVDI